MGLPMGIADEYKRFTLRLPEEVHDQLLLIARENQRSLNGEMIFIFQDFIREYLKQKRHEKFKEKFGDDYLTQTDEERQATVDKQVQEIQEKGTDGILISEKK